MKDKKKKVCNDCSRLNKVGGQAVLEGVMMKAGDRSVTTCRKEDGSIVVNDGTFVSVRKKYKILNIPIIRGVVGFVESMVLSVKTLSVSADALGLDEPDEKQKAKREKKIAEGKLDPNKKESHFLTNLVMVIATILGVLLAAALFIFLPTLAADGINALCVHVFSLPPLHEMVIAIIEGVMKMLIFIVYLCLVTLMPDIRRTFQYHGAEHKSIACFEAGEELTPENAKKHRRFHPRCGTSFMTLMIAIGILIGFLVRFILPDGTPSALVGLVKLLFLPITMGVGYEVLMLAGKHDNLFTRIVSAPGMWIQRITTKEPDEDMLEIAIISIKCALRDDFPEFNEFWQARPWENNSVSNAESAESVTDAESSESVTDAESENNVKTADDAE